MNELMQRRRALMGIDGEEPPILNPSIGYTENKCLNTSIGAPYLEEKTGAAVTDFIYAGETGNFVYFNPYTRYLWQNPNSPYCGKVLQYNGNAELQTFTDNWNCRMNGTEGSFALSASKCYVRLAVPLENLAGVYAYNSSTGQIYYAGRDTPYYGKSNIND